MDLQAEQMMRGRQAPLTKLTALLCFALACVLLIGSLVAPVKASPKGLTGASLILASPAATS